MLTIFWAAIVVFSASTVYNLYNSYVKRNTINKNKQIKRVVHALHTQTSKHVTSYRVSFTDCNKYYVSKMD